MSKTNCLEQIFNPLTEEFNPLDVQQDQVQKLILQVSNKYTTENLCQIFIDWLVCILVNSQLSMCQRVLKWLATGYYQIRCLLLIMQLRVQLHLYIEYYMISSSLIETQLQPCFCYYYYLLMYLEQGFTPFPFHVHSHLGTPI